MVLSSINDNETSNAEGEGEGRGLEDEKNGIRTENSQTEQDEGYETDGSRNEFLEPAADAVNGLPFVKFVCYRLEKLWENKYNKNRNKWSQSQKCEWILPRKMIDSLNGQTVFPYMRLLLPDQDSRRSFSVKESKIAEMYCKYLGFGKGSNNYRMLYNYSDPEIVPSGIAGNLPSVSTKEILSFCNIMLIIIKFVPNHRHTSKLAIQPTK